MCLAKADDLVNRFHGLLAARIDMVRRYRARHVALPAGNAIRVGGAPGANRGRDRLPRDHRVGEGVDRDVIERGQARLQSPAHRAGRILEHRQTPGASAAHGLERSVERQGVEVDALQRLDACLGQVAPLGHVDQPALEKGIAAGAVDVEHVLAAHDLEDALDRRRADRIGDDAAAGVPFERRTQCRVVRFGEYGAGEG